jgi:integrase
MSWIPKLRRWQKLYKGRRYTVSCRQLGCPVETKEGSGQLANEWWLKRRAEVDGANKPPSDPAVEQIGRLLQLERVPVSLCDEPELGLIASTVLGLLEKLHGSRPANADEVKAAGEKLLGLLHTGKTPPGFMVEQTSEAEAERVARVLPRVLDGQGAAVAVERSIGHQFERWLTARRARVQAGQLSPDRCNNDRVALQHFITFVGPGRNVGAIDEECYHSFYMFCAGKLATPGGRAGGAWGATYCRDVLSRTRAFVQFLYEGNLLDALPRNLRSKSLSFRVAAKAVPVVTVEEFARLYANATGQSRLHALLALNPGMTQRDISSLRDDEVDWHVGAISRKRGKTKHLPGTPVVTHRLWPRTFEMLKKHRSGGPVVLLTSRKKQWVRKELVGGRLVACDSIKCQWEDVERRAGLKRPFKLLRKSAATMIESHETYGRLTGLFLGHAPATMASKHYAQAPQALLDSAIEWLADQFKIAELPD